MVVCGGVDRHGKATAQVLPRRVGAQSLTAALHESHNLPETDSARSDALSVQHVLEPPRGLGSLSGRSCTPPGAAPRRAAGAVRSGPPRDPALTGRGTRCVARRSRRWARSSRGRSGRTWPS